MNRHSSPPPHTAKYNLSFLFELLGWAHPELTSTISSISHREYAMFIKLANGRVNKSYIKMMVIGLSFSLPVEACVRVRGGQTPLPFSQEELLNAIKSQSCQRLCLRVASWKNFLKSYLH